MIYKRCASKAYVSLPNLLAGGLPAGLALAADKRAQHTRATQKSTTHARHTKRDTRAPHKERRMDAYTGDITAAIEMGGRPRSGRPPISTAFVISSSRV